MPIQTTTTVTKLPTAVFLENYCFPEKFQEACKLCPDYGRVWSCPPNLPDSQAYLGSHEQIYLIAVKVHYPASYRTLATTPELTEILRRQSYGKAKAALRETLLALEQQIPGSVSLGAGRCEVCASCARKTGEPCRHPEKCRYSITAFGVDMAKLNEAIHVELKWAKEGLPEYDVAVAALLI